MTKTMEKDGFTAATENEGLKSDRNFHPFLELLAKVGNYVVGEIISSREATFVPKKGKNKGKRQETTYFDIRVTNTNIEGVLEDELRTISPSGLLLWQLTTGLPAGVKIPCMVGIKYMGRDDEDRHQTEVRYPVKK